MLDRLRRFVFILLSFFSCYVIFINLYGSWYAPAPQTKLDRLQTDLVLQALTNDRVQQFLGEDFLRDVYRRSLNEYLEVNDQSEVVNQVGLLYIKNEQVDKALYLWQEEGELSQSLAKLWQPEPQVLPDTEILIKQNLSRWYKYYALHRLYELVNPKSLAALDLQQTIESEEALLRLLLINLIPILGSVIGIIIILFYLIKLRKHDREEWQIPWNLEIVWQVLVAWFLSYTVIAQFLPKVLRIWLDNSFISQSLIIAITYISSMLPILGILSISLKKFPQWQQVVFNFSSFNLNSIFWAIGGYGGAIPLVVLISVGQQLLLRGHGGGNPLLEIITQSDGISSVLVFWLTLGVSAPIFEEIIFRGFLFPSLTKHFQPNFSLVISSVLFALVHMNVNDLLPLTMLGFVLGLVYDRSRNLATPILLHCFWNTGSFISLLLIR